MASVTYLRSIANNTPYTLTLVDGEAPSLNLAVGGQQAWVGSLAVPWIGRGGENHKAIRLILGPRSETNIWLFQDYWNPPHADAIKYIKGNQMDYTSDQVVEVPGNNRRGGSKSLIVNLVGRDFALYMA